MLTGRVTGQDGRPLAGARVEAVSAETEISRSVLTDGNGRYMILFPDGGGRYLVRISFIGMAELVQAVVREADEELLVFDARLSAQAIALDAINVAAQRPAPGNAAAGEQSTELPQELLNRLPLPDLDPNTVALLAAGVVGTGIDSISGQAGFSVAGMSELLNQVTLDGVVLGQGGLGVPEEGMRRTSVTTSTFDASRGGFAGGMVSMTSARGNNRAGGSFSYRLDSDALQSNASATTNAFSRHQFSGSYGGPLIQNKLFYNASLQFSRNTQHRFALAANDPLAALRSGVATDSIARFLGILENGYGFPVFNQTGPYNQETDDIRLQGRMDWNIVQERSRSHTLSLRMNTNLNSQDSTRISQLDLLQRGGEVERNNVLLATSLNSRFANNWTNALSVSFSESWNQSLPFVEMPEGRVRVTSDFADGTRQTSSLVFGGNRSMPTEAYTKDLQLSNDLSLLQPIRNQLHRFKIGGSVQYSKDVNRSTDNLFGTFTYASLEDFLNNRPDRYERSLAERQARTGALTTGLYVGDTWRVSNPLEVTLGLRWDRTALDQTPDYNPAVENLFGLRTDVDPVASAVSPRIGFNYRLNRQGQPARALSGGLGLFAGRAPTSIFSTAVRQTGLPDAEQRLICIGDAVPFADWDLYMTDPMSVPTTCADGGSGVQLSTRAPNVTIISPEQSLPSSLRADVGYRTQLPLQMNGNFRYMYSRGMGLWGYRDLNIDETNYFMLAGEDRPFFGDPAGIVERTGATSLASSRRHDEFGNVYEVVTDRESESHQVTATVSGWLPIRMMFNVNYTLGFARDQGSSGMGGFGGMGFSVPTASSPNDVEWATSSNDRRHTMNLMLTYPVTAWAEVSGMARLSSGAPYTPTVNRDINGDGMRNDRAFIFDPSSSATDPEIAAAMDRLMASAPDRVRSCLESQFGSIADRNSCRNAWTQSLDMRASLRPNLPSVQRRLTISADFRNVLTGMDQLFHGRDNMKGWGEGQRADANLLEVRGFDAAQNRFIYEVNEGFGQTRRGPNAFRNAFSVTLSARLTLGGNPMMNNRAFGQMPGGGFGGGGFGGGGMNRAAMAGAAGAAGGMVMGGGALGEIMALFRDASGNLSPDSVMAAIFVNPVPAVLSLRDSLQLTEAQVASLTTISSNLEAQHAARRTSVEPVVRQLVQAVGSGGQPNIQALMPMMQDVQLTLQPNMQGAQRETAQAMQSVQAELQPEQWERIPQLARAAAQQPAAGQGGRGGMGFNAVGMLDRMLANPLPVLLELRETLQLNQEQVSRITAISEELQTSLNRRREELGRRFDNVQGAQSAQLFAEIQPDIERSRQEIRTALQQVERILTREQWNQVPDQIRNPFQQTGPGQGVRRGGGGG
ncbi:MAG TPA: TonB-dependent receptor [Longimicrobiales bacterium]|nr:TonB-dependent receptor [Longimicrobiales bacterium]